MSNTFLSHISKPIIMATVASVVLTGCFTEKPLATHELTVQGAYAAAISDDGKLAAVGSIVHGGSLWRTNPLDRLFNWNHRQGQQTNIEHIDFSPEGKFAATADDRTISLWNTETGEPIWLWNTPSDINDLALTNEGRLAILGLDNYSVTLFDIQNGGILRSFQHQGEVYDVSLDKSSQLAASGSEDNTAKVWSLTRNKMLLNFVHKNPVRLAQLSEDGSLLFTSAENEQGYVWDLNSSRKIATLKIKRGYFTAAKFQNNLLLTGNTAGNVEIWDISRGKNPQPKKRWTVQARNPWVYKTLPIMDLAFGRSQTILVTANGLLYEFK